MYHVQISHRIKPYEVSVHVALVEKYGTFNQKEQKKTLRTNAACYVYSPSPSHAHPLTDFLH
jgi:hypothetical protein